MHFNHYTLRHLSRYLDHKHQGEQIVDVFSQNKQELVIELESGFLRIGCHTPLTFVVPVQEYARARKNVVELFPEMVGQRVEGCRVLSYERVIVLALSGGYDLICKMHGIGANVLLRKEGTIERLFVNRLEADWNYAEAAGRYDESAIQVAEEPENEQGVLQALRTISPVYEKEFARKIWQDMQKGQRFEQSYTQLIADLEQAQFYIRRDPTRMKFLLFDAESEMPTVSIQGIEPALNLFLRTHYQYFYYLQQYKATQKEIGKPIAKYRKVYQSYSKNVHQLEIDRNPEEIGHLIMANLHAIPAGMKEAEVEDFYTAGTVKIRLKPELSPQENAARYYEKSKQRKGKLRYLKSQLLEIEDKLLTAELEVERFESLPLPEALTLSEEGFDYAQLKLIRKATKQLSKEQQASEEGRSPFRTYQKEGYQIFVGKNARNSDELSFKFATKNDTWLHAKDVTGSHVIIRHRAGQNVPIVVLEFAAGLAAWFSKRKNDGLVPVQFTPRKYIRKRKGDAPGKVVVDREEVIMVEPVKP